MPRKREKIKIIVLFRSYTRRNRKFQKINKKIQKIVKYYYGFISSNNKGKNAEKERKLKLSFRSVPTQHVIETSKKIETNFRKFENTIVASFQAIIG